METEYLDQTILALRAKYLQNKPADEAAGGELVVGTKKIPLHREALFDHKCSIMLPVILRDMRETERGIKYRGGKLPRIIKTDADRDAAITFDILPVSEQGEPENVLTALEQIRNDMKKVWKQNVFYDIGETQADGLPVAWMDFRAFCLDGSLYSMIFLFRLEEQTVMGNFHCSFAQYDAWKPAILRSLTTIQKGEVNDERISD